MDRKQKLDLIIQLTYENSSTPTARHENAPLAPSTYFFTYFLSMAQKWKCSAQTWQRKYQPQSRTTEDEK